MGAERESKERRLAEVLGEITRALLWASGLLAPFIPESAERIASAFASRAPNPYARPLPGWLSAGAGAQVRRGDVLFRKLAEADLAAAPFA